MIEIKTGEWMIGFATLMGPVLAVQAQKWIERITERRRRKQLIFETLMATRATRLSLDHVRALNQIELDFVAKGDRAVVTAWRAYADILNEAYADDDEAGVTAWAQRRDDSFLHLMQVMAEALGYKLEKPHIRRGIYYPKGFDLTERRNNFIQEALARVLGGKLPLKMEVISFPQPSDEATAQQAKLQERLLKALGPQGTLRVELQPNKSA